MRQVTERLRTRPFERQSERGAVLVEFAIVAPLLVLLLLGIADMGQLIHAHQVVQNAAREGAHFASLPANNPLSQTASVAAIKQRVVNYCLQENIVITAADVTVDQNVAMGPFATPDEPKTVSGSQVSVSYNRSTIFLGLPFTSLTLTGFSIFRNLYGN